MQHKQQRYVISYCIHIRYKASIVKVAVVSSQDMQVSTQSPYSSIDGRSHHTMKMYRGVEVQLHMFMTSALDGLSGQLHAPASLPPEKSPLVPISQAPGWAPEPARTP